MDLLATHQLVDAYKFTHRPVLGLSSVVTNQRANAKKRAKLASNARTYKHTITLHNCGKSPIEFGKVCIRAIGGDTLIDVTNKFFGDMYPMETEGDITSHTCPTIMNSEGDSPLFILTTFDKKAANKSDEFWSGYDLVAEVLVAPGKWEQRVLRLDGKNPNGEV